MLYIILRGHWFHIIVLDVRSPTEDKIDDVKDSFYEELERIFDTFPKYSMKILLGDFNAEDIFKLTIGNESLHKIGNNNGVNFVVKSKMFPHHNSRKCTWTSPNGKSHNQIDHIQIDR
jgi:hypothetical protein